MFILPSKDDDDDDESEGGLTEMANANSNPYNWRGLTPSLEISVDTSNCIPHPTTLVELPNWQTYESPMRSEDQKASSFTKYEAPFKSRNEDKPRAGSPLKPTRYEMPTLSDVPISSRNDGYKMSVSHTQESPSRGIRYEMPKITSSSNSQRASFTHAATPSESRKDFPPLMATAHQQELSWSAEKQPMNISADHYSHQSYPAFT